MTALLTSEQVDALNYKECKAALKLLLKTYDFEKPVMEMTKEEFALVDDIGNTLLWLEDRIKLFDDPRIPSMDPQATVVKPKKEVDPTKAKRPPRRFSMQGVIYESVREASLKTGIKPGTLMTYTRRKPDQYFYID